ncbi:MAG: IMPACT family protein [Deltaproteobacteria bacterium]|nr:IMPACT family protein [Deltaproteobacteria bacterium]
MITLAARHRFETEVKRSRFIALAAPAASPEEALAFLGEARDENATHNCWAYKVGALYRFSDDGEPSGTAGRPILGAIESQGVDHVMVVVVRHFGGIKLGTGGLARAYGGAAAECLRTAPRIEVKPRVTVRVKAPFDATGAIHSLFDRFDAHKRGEDYGANGATFEVELAEDALPSFEHAVADATRGRAAVTPLEP